MRDSMSVESQLSPERMSEAEVAIRFALHLLTRSDTLSPVTICLDRHHVLSNRQVVFPVREFLSEHGWNQVEQIGKYPWLGIYQSGDRRLIVSPDSTGGDVVATVGQRSLRVECKKGRLHRTKGNPENRLIHEAIGQLMVIKECRDDDVLIVAVPNGIGQRAKQVWQNRPLMKRTGISIVLVGRDGSVDGLNDF